jgi:hypothetical protein
VINVLKIRLVTLREYYEQYEKAEDNPQLQNLILCSMRFECDKLNLSVLDYILEMRNEKQKALQKQPAAFGKATNQRAAVEMQQAMENGLLSPVPVAETPDSSNSAPTEAFPCQLCGKTFATQKALSGHQKGHRKETLTKEPITADAQA